jgi:tungstate transport system substrate-binding protein
MSKIESGPVRVDGRGGKMKKTAIIGILVILLASAVAVAAVAGCGKSKPTTMVMATTTSTQDSGLLDVLLPAFEKKYNVKVKTLAVGSGEAMKIGERGDADVLMVHSPAAEETFVKNGLGLERVQFMYNDYVILGPNADPAGIKGSKTAVEAYQKIAAAGAAGTTAFVSRADLSGTNTAELKIWKEAGISPKGQPWYVETGQGMGETLNITNQKQAYTMADRATYLSMKANLQLTVLVEGDKALYNQYSIIVVNPAKHTGLKLNTKNAGDLAEYVTGKSGQDLIGSYKKYDVVLFHPNAKAQTRGMGNYKEQQ